MTINSVSTLASTPFCGLATQTYNVPTTGLYSLAAKVNIPWETSDSPGYTAAVANVETVTTVADSSGSLNSTWWKFYLAGNALGFYVWYNINSAGVDPAPAGLIGIEVDGATGVTANNLATATRAAISAATISLNGVSTPLTNYVKVSGATNAVILTNVQAGTSTAAADGTAATGFGFSVGTAGTFGSQSGLVMTAKHGTSILFMQLAPSPTQASMSSAATVQCTAGDTLTLVTSSLANVDAQPNAVKGVLNVGPGIYQ